MGQNTMKAYRFYGAYDCRMEDVPIPEIVAPDDAIVKVTIATICGSDLHFYKGEMGPSEPKTVGHEYCGEVVAVGENVHDFKPGDAVIVRPAYYCGECYMCKQGMTSVCMNAGCIGVPNGPDGCFAEYCRVKYANTSMVHLPENLTPEETVMISDVYATAYYGLKHAKVKAGDTVAVYGLGPIGMAACQLAKVMFNVGKVIAVNRSKAKLEFVKEKGFADNIICASEEDPAPKVLEFTNYIGADVVIESVGREDVLNKCLELARCEGTVSSVSVSMAPMAINWALMIGKNLTIQSGMQCFDGCDEMLELMKAGKLDGKWLGTHKSPLNDIKEAYELFEKNADGCRKWLISPYDHNRSDVFEFKIENCRFDQYDQ